MLNPARIEFARTRRRWTKTRLAEALGVKGPFVTRLASALTKKDLVVVRKSMQDSRVRTITLTDKGKKLVVHIENSLRKESRR